MALDTVLGVAWAYYSVAVVLCLLSLVCLSFFELAAAWFHYRTLLAIDAKISLTASTSKAMLAHRSKRRTRGNGTHLLFSHFRVEFVLVESDRRYEAFPIFSSRLCSLPCSRRVHSAPLFLSFHVSTRFDSFDATCVGFALDSSCGARVLCFLFVTLGGS